MGSQSSCCSNNKVKAEEENSEIITDGNIFEKKRYKTSINGNNKTLKDFSTSIIIRKYNSPSKIRKIIKIQSYIKMIIFKDNLKVYCKQRKKEIIKELEKYIIINPENIILNHKGEILHNKFKKEYPQLIYDYSKFLKYNSEYTTIKINKYIQMNKNEIYIGSFNLNKKYNGYGILYMNSNNNYNKYEGIFNNGKLENFSYGIYSSLEIIYYGYWKNNLKNGEGEEIYLGNNKNNFYYYKGKYLNDSKIYGKLYFKDNSFYEGSFNENDKFNGKGIFFWGKNNMKYEGDFLKGEMTGQGKIMYNDGSYYEGQFLDNKKHGFGNYYFSNQDKEKKIYCGEWKNDFMEGKGKFIYGNKVIEGIWEKGKFVKEM